MKAHFLLHIVAYMAYLIAIFLLILAIAFIVVIGDMLNQAQPISTPYGYQTIPPFFLIAIPTPIFLLSWGFFWGGVITAAFADLVKSSMETNKILEERFGRRK